MYASIKTKELCDNLIEYLFKTVSLITKSKAIGIKFNTKNDLPFYYYKEDYSIQNTINITSYLNCDVECLYNQIINQYSENKFNILTKKGTLFINSFSNDINVIKKSCEKCTKKPKINFEKLKNFILIPIRMKGKCIGIFHLIDTNEELDNNKINQLEEILSIFSNMLLKLKIKTKNIEKEYDNLSKLAKIDYLTGLNNRLSLENKIKEEENKIKHYGDKFKFKWSILYIDLDNFKYYNDNFDHFLGDIILKKFAEILKNSCRLSDFIARYGGDEFIIILPHTEADEAKILAERILRKLKMNNFFKDIIFNYVKKEINIPQDMTLSCSIGIVEYKNGLMFKDLIRLADHAMYFTKKNGKNNYFILRDFLDKELNSPVSQKNIEGGLANSH